MDIDFIINIFPLFKKAFLLTFEISIIGISLSIIFGFIISLLVFYKVPYLCVLSRIFIEISRNTPLIIQLFFLYFGLSYWIKLPNFWCGVIGVAFLGSSYMAESFRLGFAEIKKIHIESALALGFSKIAIFRHIIFPQSIGISMPHICANVLFLIKETSIVGVIALEDLMSFTKNIISIYGHTNEALLMIVVAYLIILLPLSIMFYYLEKIYSRYL